MSKRKEAEDAPVKPVASEEQRGIRVAQLLFKTTTLGAAVVTCALGYPKVPPFAGD
jgi:hypothetical protein